MGFDDWMDALEKRHLADLRLPEVTRALRALSSAYVERRHKVSRVGALDSAGKRAAFALFYEPLHFLVGGHVIESIACPAQPLATTVRNARCGSGATGA